MNRMGRDTVSVVMDKLPILNKVIDVFIRVNMQICIFVGLLGTAEDP